MEAREIGNGSGPIASEGLAPLITKRDLCMLLHKSPRTIENWVSAGYLNCIKVGRSVFFERDQVFKDLRRFSARG